MNRFLKFTFIVAMIGCWLWLATRYSPPSSSDSQVSVSTVISILRSENMAFLVTRRTSSQIVIDYSQTDWLGQWRGVLWATVSWRYGCDLSKLTADDIRRQGQTLTVKLPDPQLLDFSYDPGSVGFMSKSTAIPKLQEIFSDGQQRRTLEGQLRSQAEKFSADHGLMPSRSQIVEQLNGTIGGLAGSGRIVFE